jgi:hypothetical protein
MAPLPEIYDTCDVLYADIPWPAGYQVFNDRAGVEGAPDYELFMLAVSSNILRFIERGRAVVIVAGKQAQKLLPSGALAFETKLNGAAAVAYTWGMNRDVMKRCLRVKTSEGVLEQLARHYTRVGDFCCGYGRAGRIFLGAGGTFVMSDLNAGCIGYIAEHAHEWRS